MKTRKDLEKMKKEKCVPFGTEYDYFFGLLENYYIGKMNGVERIEAELRNWDKDTQHFIVNELVDRIAKSGIMGFDRNEILSLIQ